MRFELTLLEFTQPRLPLRGLFTYKVCGINGPGLPDPLLIKPLAFGYEVADR